MNDHPRGDALITVHMAGPPQLGGLYQECSRCGHVLQNYTGGPVMVLDDQADMGLPAWPEGGRVAVDGAASWAMAAGVPLEAHETECRTSS